MIAPSQTAAASAKLMLPGMVASDACSRTQTYSACVPKRPALTPKTRSPTANSLTAAPIASTSPASSVPRIGLFGRSRLLKKRTMNGSGRRKPQSVLFTVVA
jgi:hypothetical protein